MTTVETAAYKLPQDRALSQYRDYSYFRETIEKKLDILDRDGGFSSSHAQNYGFNYRPQEIVSRKGTWYIFDRFDHQIPNFPEGGTTIDAMLGIYDKGEREVNVVLRVSSHAFFIEQFREDLDTFSRYYIDRPSDLRLPSRFISSRSGVISFAAGGAAIGAAMFASIASREGGYPALAAILGLMPGAILGLIPEVVLYQLSEGYAKRKIYNLDQYMAGQHVPDYLRQEQSHINNVLIQREVYSTLQAEGIDMTPDDFLGKIYTYMPAPLVQARVREMAQVRQSNQQTEQSVVLPKIVQIARDLQATA